jgi:hypothetical protein
MLACMRKGCVFEASLYNVHCPEYTLPDPEPELSKSPSIYQNHLACHLCAQSSIPSSGSTMTLFARKEEKEREVVQSLLFLPSTYHSPFRKERKNVLRAKVFPLPLFYNSKRALVCHIEASCSQPTSHRERP